MAAHAAPLAPSALERHAAVPAPGSWTRYLRGAVAAAVAVSVAVVVVANRAAIDSGGDTLAGANLQWLGVALALVSAVWLAGAASALGAVPIRPPLRQLLAVQVAASVVNHLMPAGVGGMAVNVRYLERSGMSRSAAVAAVGMSSVATLVTHIALIASLWFLVPAVLTGGALSRLVGLASGGLGAVVHRVLLDSPLLAGGAAFVAVGIVVAAAAAGAVRRRAAVQRLRTVPARVWAHVRRELRDAGHVLRDPGRAALLWGGSAASPGLHALILLAVYHSLSGGVSGLVVALVYLVATAVAALVPSPGGFGALDVTLVAGLVAVGAPTTTALAAVLGYRLITVWLPLVPGALVFALLLRRRIL